MAPAALYAAAELAAGLALRTAIEPDRAEIAPFLAVRPWLLVVFAVAVLLRPAPQRHAVALLALLMASAAEIAVAALLGAPPPLADAARGLGAATLWWALLAIAALLFRRRWMLLAAGLAALLLPGVLPLWQRLTVRPDPPAARPITVAMLTGLPILWGDPREQLVAATLRRRLRLIPIDSLSAETLTAPLLLVAQPHPPGPAGLVALDAWVRHGGRVLILTDPALRWAEDRRPDDPLRPPEDDGLGPLLAHWGLRLDRADGGVVPLDLRGRRLLLVDPGRFGRVSGACRLRAAGRLAECAIGRGRALLLADADLLHPDAWIGAGPDRAHRVADNPVAVTDLVEELAGRPDHAARVVWTRAAR